jgi:hypothetical protein
MPEKPFSRSENALKIPSRKPVKSFRRPHGRGRMLTGLSFATDRTSWSLVS